MDFDDENLENDNGAAVMDMGSKMLVTHLMKILCAPITAAAVADFCHCRQQTQANQRQHEFTCFDQLSPDILAVVAGLVSVYPIMWEDNEEQLFLDPLESTDDYNKLRKMIKEKENDYLDILQDAYPSPHDSGGNSENFFRSLKMKMPREFMSKQDIARLNEFFARLQDNHGKCNFTDEQQRQICNTTMKQVDVEHQVMLRLKAKAHPDPKPSTIHGLKIAVMTFALKDQPVISWTKERGYEVTVKPIPTKDKDTDQIKGIGSNPGSSGLSVDEIPNQHRTKYHTCGIQKKSDTGNPSG